MSKKNNKFPILGYQKYKSCPAFIQWSELDDGWAKLIHSQDLERLASRGGLSPIEIVYNINKLQYGTKVDAVFAVRLINKVNKNKDDRLMVHNKEIKSLANALHNSSCDLFALLTYTQDELDDDQYDAIVKDINSRKKLASKYLT